MSLPDFPDAFLKPRRGLIYGKSGEWAVIIALELFGLDGDTVDTQIVFDPFPWEVEHARALVNQTHVYDAGDIEGSIYLRSAHHPVALTRIAFGSVEGDALHATIDCDFVFDFEGAGFQNRSAKIQCLLHWGEPKGVRSYRVIQ